MRQTSCFHHSRSSSAVSARLTPGKARGGACQEPSENSRGPPFSQPHTPFSRAHPSTLPQNAARCLKKAPRRIKKNCLDCHNQRRTRNETASSAFSGSITLL